MLSEKRRATLESMYALVGTHSAVKLCRWQKSMMRGRGGCYKWTMYGIQSHQCMEATPSMACANKCVFCWRLNTNPTATEWKWQVDDPQTIVDGMLSSHKALIQGVRGMPGVTEKGLEEAMNPKHCALSLVGESVLYPYVNAFLHLLHEKGMSTFLVNNGQFPDALKELTPVTQLYLSVDAPNRETMKLLDRPVFSDYWERFQHSIAHMSQRKERTVFRLTMISGFNMSEENLLEYKAVFETGRPNFVELKRLTPAFSGNRQGLLRIKNVPSWEQLKAYGNRLCEVIFDGKAYEVASLHEHSGCILLAEKKFKIDGVWHTWIDFEKFNAMILDPVLSKQITADAYLRPTPLWALPESAAEGFDPSQTRHVTARRLKHIAAVKNAND
ncbi:putative radical SAM domain protein [Trypanosoma rangeli]|uniref:Putative radical SAM domain protein n=1 Tax=Trypanosoma rangeli TaxID=5698 RepID=A0A422N5E5_TRYRA|nr:putative radical SAM domain protein [Trypanosoma rangeli]RNF00670.1 putative radical SAM domain protein [Trypanosoma rangeli]|eukprot:RNF00670.1 putative radical SAM domain protein [Trypanosoma rangeli]